MARATRPQVLERLLDKLWPDHKVEKDGTEHMVECPFCDTEKPKCAINPNKGVFHCWVCEEKGPVSKLLEHLYSLKLITQGDIGAVTVGKGAPALSDVIQAVKPKKAKKPIEQLWTQYVPCVYPPHTQELTTMLAHNTIQGKLRRAAFDYLNSRKVTDENIKDFRLAFCTELGSPYYAHIFFPALGKWGRQLTFWTTRSILPNPNPKSLHASHKYSRFSAKQILVNEHLVVGTSVVLCEGPFDAVSIMNATGIPACPLLGKVLHPFQKTLLMTDKDIQRVYICLDPDAQAFQAKIASMFTPPREVWLVNLKEGDPNEVSLETLRAAFSSAAPSASPSSVKEKYRLGSFR